MKTTSLAHSRWRHGLAAVFLGLLAIPWAAQAAEFSWNCTDGNWSTATCWNPVGVPTSSDTAFVPTVSGGDTSVTIDSTTGTANAASLTIDASDRTTVTLQQIDGDLSAGTEVVGDVGTGGNAFIQSGGTHTVSNVLYVGGSEDTRGSYNLSGGTLTVGSSAIRTEEFIGLLGSGTFTQTGGTHTVHGILVLGEVREGRGHYNLVDGSLSADSESIGGDGAGNFNQSGGTNIVGRLGFGGNVFFNTYNLSGGTLTAGDVATGDAGAFNITGGTFTATNLNHTSEIFDLAGGTLRADNFTNTGTFNYSGGSLITTSFTSGYATGGEVNFSGAGTRTVVGTVVNNFRITATNTTVSFTGSVTNNGVYASQAATSEFTTLTVNDSGYLTGETGDVFLVSGDFINHSLQNTAWNTDYAKLRVTGAGLHNLYLAGADLGNLASARNNNFAWREFTLDAGVSLRLWDGNANPGAALYVGLVELGDGLAQLSSIYSDFNIYYEPTLAGNAYLGDKTYALNGRGFLMPAASAPILEPIEHVNGTIWDVGSDRILFLDNSEDTPKLKIRDRASGEDVAIPSADAKEPNYGYLSVGGAVFVADAGVYEWKNGALEFLGYPNSFYSLKVSEDTKRYAIWNGGFSNLFERLLILRDLTNGTNVVVRAGDVGNWFNDVTDRGEVVYWIGAGWSGPGDTTYDYNIFRYRDGVTTRLTNDQYFWNTYVLTDGINVVYRKHDPCCGTQRYQITMYNDELGEVTLRPMGESEPSPGWDFQPRGGWVAFTKPGESGLLQVWVRSPLGRESQISSFNTSSYIDALAPNGEVTFITNGRRYLGAPGTSPIDIGASDGKSLWLEGKWYVYIRGTLYQVAISVQNPVTQLITKLKDVISAINSLDSGVFKNANMKKALTNKLNAVLELVDEGLYRDALDKLENDILQKMDGCANTGAPDNNDWINDCAAQNRVYPLIRQAIELLQTLI